MSSGRSGPMFVILGFYDQENKQLAVHAFIRTISFQNSESVVKARHGAVLAKHLSLNAR